MSTKVTRIIHESAAAYVTMTVGRHSGLPLYQVWHNGVTAAVCVGAYGPDDPRQTRYRDQAIAHADTLTAPRGVTP